MRRIQSIAPTPLSIPTLSHLPRSVPDTEGVSLSEVLSALSYALDLTEGAPAGHTMRSCLIGMRLAEEAGIGPAERSALYYAILLKDAGCSSNAGRMAALFGSDDQWVKPRMKMVDWHQRVRLAVTTAMTVGHGRPIVDRVRQFIADRKSVV